MSAFEAKLKKSRDFFVLRTSIAALRSQLPGVSEQRVISHGVVLELQRSERANRGLAIDGELTPAIPFPAGCLTLINLLTSPKSSIAAGDVVEVLLARQAFDAVTDEIGAARLLDFDLKAGVAVEDETLRHLGFGLEQLAQAAEGSVDLAADRIGSAMTLHLAQRYGGLSAPATPAQGALRPWQLRLARTLLNQHLDVARPIESVARACGLSMSHFSRAFTRSTGLPPHRWLMQRRIEAAKEMLRSELSPLAQIALQCGFADQSHFTRAFAAITGSPPGRWRLAQG